jgi:hypothetical protein
VLHKQRLLNVMPVRDRIFISYRRSDTEGYAGRLEDTLREYFGKDRVSRDIGGIVPGEDFKQKSEEIAARAAAVIVLIGPNWLSSQTGGKPRLHEPGDLVATEIKAALDRGHVIVPVLVQGANMPREEDLPDALKELARRNAVSVSDANWVPDTTRLAKVLAIDVRSAVERKLDWLKLAVISLLVTPLVFSLLMIAIPEFRNKAIRNEADGETFVFKLMNPSLEKLRPEVREILQAQRAELEKIEDRNSKDKLRKSLKDITGIKDADIEAILTCCTWSVADQKKAETQAISAVNPICILLVSLLLGLTRTWIDPPRRKFIWAAIAVGCVGVMSTFFYYLRNVEDSLYIWPSDEYFAFIATSIIISIVLGLLALSGFKPNDSIR